MDKEYEALKKKYNLPSADLLDKEFEISAIEEYTFLLRSIRFRISEKLEHAIKIFNELLHPDTGFAAFRESSTFTESDRDKMLDVYKRLMFYHRRSLELDFEDSDEINARYINEFMKDWPDLRRSVLFFVRKMKESWQKEISKKEVVGYLG